MSTTGPISNYYVDSLINHESEEVLASRFSAPELLPAGSRPSPLVPECSDFPSCSFAPKPPVFTSSWGPVHSQSSVVYHPYHQPHLGTDSRYVRSWLEPISGAVSFPGYPANSRHYGLKPDGIPERRPGDCIAGNGRGYPDYYYGSSPDLRDKTQQIIPSPEAEALVSGKLKEDKPELDPSKYKLRHHPCLRSVWWRDEGGVLPLRDFGSMLSVGPYYKTKLSSLFSSLWTPVLLEGC